MVDYRRFLSKKEHAVLPWLGGPRVFAKDRALRLASTPAEHGFWRFEIEGRNARAIERAEPDYSSMEKVRGHVVGDWLFGERGVATALELVSAEELPPLSPCAAYRTFGGDCVFASVEFDGDAELAARSALEEERALGDEKGIGSSLRAAFGYALAARVARRARWSVSPAEVRPHAQTIAENGVVAVMPLLEELERVRNLGRVRVGAERRLVDVRRAVARAHGARVQATLANAEERAEAALEAAGARLSSCRSLGPDALEVKFRFADQRFICIAHPLTLNVLDAGICLVDHEDGHRGDGELTLDSLPSAIREAMDLGALVITRRA